MVGPTARFSAQGAKEASIFFLPAGPGPVIVYAATTNQGDDTVTRKLLFTLTMLAALPPVIRADEPAKKLLEIADLYRFDGPAALRLSPDEKRAVYVRQWVDADTRQRRQALWLVEEKPGNTRP